MASTTGQATVTAGRSGLIDADGHVLEDLAAIIGHLPKQYRELREPQLRSAVGNEAYALFPSLGFLSNIPVVMTGAYNRDPVESGRDLDSWLYFVEAVGIETSVLYPTAGLTTGTLRDPSYAVALTRAYNDWIAETYVAHPSGRFQAAALLPLQDPTEAARELRRAVTELGLRGAVLPAHGLVESLGSRRYYPVYEAAEDLDVGLSCHGGVHIGLGMDDFTVFAPVHALGHPFGLLISLGSMLFGKVFDDFPGLRVAYLEGGSAWILMAAERFSESYGALRPVEVDDRVCLEAGWRVVDYLKRLLQEGRIVLGCEGGEDHLQTVIEYFDCVPFMYSSDFPHEVGIASCRHELEELQELEVSGDAKRRIRGDTARTFYRL